jgi:hypothetical protein
LSAPRWHVKEAQRGSAEEYSNMHGHTVELGGVKTIVYLTGATERGSGQVIYVQCESGWIPYRGLCVGIFKLLGAQVYICCRRTEGSCLLQAKLIRYRDNATLKPFLLTARLGPGSLCLFVWVLFIVLDSTEYLHSRSEMFVPEARSDSEITGRGKQRIISQPCGRTCAA